MLKVLGAMKSCNVDDWHNDVYNLDKTKRQWLTSVINFMREKTSEESDFIVFSGWGHGLARGALKDKLVLYRTCVPMDI